MLRWRKWWKQPLPMEKPVTTLASTPLIQPPFPSLMQRGQRTQAALAFINRQSSMFQKTGGDNDGLLGLRTDYLTEERRLPREGVLFPLFVLLLLGQ